MVKALASWIEAHPVLFAVFLSIAVKFVSGLASWLTRPKSELEWQELKRRAPRRAAVLLLLKSWDLDPSSTLRALAGLVTGVLPPQRKP
jgi:hypothetical protein